ncbi:hypothetical protein LRS06_02495 [Hymenobacter sp. J193]|uniref:hypothetical protein n=1 Tax=Hymenobacter sp. J193 TaxID=2898429 RepID=UPI002151580D|nr:hypothetical protein [Hymenobacter sp. J193]MCR5886661.1 hypothetical protein [Hymenobacter sp. J193]
MLHLELASLYFENPIGRLYAHADGYIIVDFKAGPRDRQAHQAFLTHLENLMKSRGWNKMIANQRLMAPYTEEERQWIKDQWLIVSHAIQKEMVAAVLLPEDVFARLAMSTMMQQAREGALVYCVFTDGEQAAAWLKAYTDKK